MWNQQPGWNQQGGQQQQGFNQGGGFQQQGFNQGGGNQQQGFNQGGFKNQEPEKPFKYFHIIAKCGGRAMDICQDGEKKGHLIVWDPWDGPNQQFGFVGAGDQKMIVNKQGMYLTVVGNSNNDGAAIVGAPYTGAPGQKFGLLPVKQGSADYFITTHCGKVLDVSEEGKKNGTPIIQYHQKHDNNKNQLFTLKDA